MNAIKEVIRLVEYDWNLQTQDYPIEVCKRAAAELAALEAVVEMYMKFACKISLAVEYRDETKDQTRERLISALRELSTQKELGR